MSAGKTVRYGLVGLGNVGSDLVRDATAAGLDVHVFDIAEPAVARAVETGAVRAPDAAALARDVDVLVLSLPNADVVDDVLFNAGAFDGLTPGSTLVDMSTNLPERAMALAEEGARRGVGVLDAPVTYGPEGLVSFVGGPVQDAADVAAWLDAAVSRWIHVGPQGHGQYVKLVQNVLTGVGMGVVAEVLGFAARAGVDLDLLPEALRHTGAHSRLLERTIPAMVARRYGASGTMALHSKDMGYALRAADQVGARMPFTAALREVFEDVLATGDRRWTQTALIEWYSPSAAEDRERAG